MIIATPDEREVLRDTVILNGVTRACSITPVRSLAGLLFRAVQTGVLPSFREVNHALDQNGCEGCTGQQGERIRVSACMKQRIIDNFGPALPTEEAFAAFESWGPFLEVGATTGLWSAILYKRGINVIACAEPFDRRGLWSRKIPITHVAAPTMVTSCPERTILMVWPEHAEWPLHVLEAMQPGQRLVAITEGRYGHYATEDFFDYLGENFHRDLEQSLPLWLGAQDYIHTHTKR